MEGLYTFMDEHSDVFPAFDLNNGCENFKATEIHLHERSLQLRTKLVQDKAILPWLQTYMDPSKPENEPSALFRVVWVPLRKEPRPWVLDIRKSHIDRILDSFGIKTVHKYSFTGPAGFMSLPAAAGDSDRLQCSVFMPDLFAMTWTHNLSTGKTEALCWGDEWVMKTTLDVLVHQQKLARRPMFPALLAGMMLGHLLDRDLHRHNRTVAETENRTRYHPWRNTPVGIAEGSYASLSARMSGCAAALAGLERICKLLHETLDATCAYPQRQQTSDDDMETTVFDSGECVEVLRKRLHMQEVQICYLARRVEIQLRALFNLIAQRETQISISVAEDSRTLASATKDDSTAMKTLAAVTVAFLPSTFVAAFFSMPLFQWDAARGGAILSERFWIYWAVSLPLTFVTLLSWFSWTRSQTLRHRAQDAQARQQLYSEIDGSRHQPVGAPTSVQSYEKSV